MTGDIVIDGKNATTLLENHFQFPILQQKFMKIENWTGSIKIIHTDFQNLSFFKSLVSVKTDFPGSSFDEDDIHNEMRYATFWIESNPNITSLGIPSLKQVTADVLPTIRTVYGFYLKNNAELCLSDSEFWMLRKMERSLLFGMKICGAVTKQYCYQSHFDHTNLPLGCQILLTGIWLNEIKKYKLTFAMFPLSVLLFLFSFISNACVCGAMSQIPEPFKNERAPQNLTSLSLFLQALFILIVGLFSEGLNHMFSSSPALVQQVRDFDYFFYFWGSIIMRWHYAIILLIQTAFISHTFVMFSVDDIPTPKHVSP
ncbi:hypothetical protein GCK72_024852 [Caenorhabditis remanei]|uniref:Receptor L-domain domain-containing protein n=1 Tax=Caenorhabditis remanei TaxID=31234 RepID=A0A6A5G151_CAERE|nr:hypothetical protein GCK72_024852 [Caenorhabditis remanei]KAF1748385.1 hypothetical protein GCK72_024852 [Caenorhabditis remanei]